MVICKKVAVTFKHAYFIMISLSYSWILDEERIKCYSSIVQFLGVGILSYRDFCSYHENYIYHDNYNRRAWVLLSVLRQRSRGFEPHRRHCVVSLSKNINPSIVRLQSRKTRPFITERLLMGHKESNQTNKQNLPFPVFIAILRCYILIVHSCSNL